MLPSVILRMSEFISNRKGEKISVLVERQPNHKGLAFVMHGLGGFKEQEHIIAIARAFNEAGYTVVRFDTTHAQGESDGALAEVTPTKSYEDLEDVIQWVGTQQWYQEPFSLSGYSLGGFCVAYYAENHPEKVKALILAAPAISGKFVASTRSREELERWQRRGYQEYESKSMPGVVKRVNWTFMADYQYYDLLLHVDRLIMPVLIIVGEHDVRTPPAHQRQLYDLLPGKKEMHVVKGAEHGFYQESERREVQSVLLDWLVHEAC